jgi:hypothetical protein
MTDHPSLSDTAIGTFCVVLTLVLVLADMPLWLVLALPLIAYAGLRLIFESHSAPARRPRRPSPENDQTAYATCISRRQDIWSLSARLDDVAMRDLVRSITERIDVILRAIAEDDAYRAAPALLGLLDPTRDLLVSYLRVVERKLDSDDGRERVMANLLTLDAAYARFWERLNRAEVVRLDALNDTIDFYLDRPDAMMRLGGRA